MREKVIEEYLRDQIKAIGGIAYKFVSPGNVGVPDRLVVLPGGHVIFAEMKAPGGKLTSMQQNQISKIRMRDADVWVLASKQEVDVFIGYCKGLIGDEAE